MAGRCSPQLVHTVAVTCMEGEMAQARATPVMISGTRRRLEYEVGLPSLPAPAVQPLLVEHVPEFAKESMPRPYRRGQVCRAQLDVVQAPNINHPPIIVRVDLPG